MLEFPDMEEVGTKIYQAKIVSYMDTVWKGLLITIFVVLFSEILMFFGIKIINISQDSMFIQSRWIPNRAYFIRHIVIPTSINLPSYIILKFLYSKASFMFKKVWFTLSYFIVATVYVMGHWGFIYMSVIYVIPILLVCPLGKKTILSAFFTSIVLSGGYLIYQNKLLPSLYHAFIYLISLGALVATFFLAINMNSSFQDVLRDIAIFVKSNEELNEQVEKDSLTGSFNKTKFLQDVASVFYNSLAFIDLDNFKQINYEKGHLVGDDILKQLVAMLSIEHNRVYRFGGDEFVILSFMPSEDLKMVLDLIREDFSYICQRQFKVDASFSAGIINYIHGETYDDLILRSDNLMYQAKREGKNLVCVEKK